MWQTIGHEWAVELLQRGLDTQHIAHAYLFTGPANVGKAHLAVEFASALNCTGDGPPCGSCRACVKTARRTHPDVIRTEPDGDRIKIDQVRGLQYDLALSPHEGQWRVCIISDFQTATVEAENALLKTLEEPPSRAVMILTATDASLLLPTIVSRCQVLPLRLVPTEQIVNVLVERFGGPEDRARLVARLSAGRVGWALEAMKDDSLLEQRRQRIEELWELVQQGQAARILAAERLSKLANVNDIVRLWQAWWRDLVLACSGCEELITNQDFLETLRRLAGVYDLAEAEAAVRGTGEALRRFDQNVNTRLALEALLLSWRRVSLA